MKLMEKAAITILFCAAAAIFIFQYKVMNQLITSSKADLNKQDVLYEQNREELKKDKVSYVELLTSLMGNIDYDIQIDNIIIIRKNYNYQNFDFRIIPKKAFTKSYQYDSSGNIIKVIYLS